MRENDPKRVGGSLLDRRGWLAAVLAGWATTAGRAEEPGRKSEEERDLEGVRARARAVGLGPLRSGPPTAHYQSIGDAPLSFQTRALELCESLARDYLKHFQDKGFTVALPDRRLTVVALADPRGFARFTGEEEGSVVAGIYEPKTNRLIIFDNRAGGAADPRLAERANTIALMHEATHQLTFNTGLLVRDGDVPLCLSEGLAMYGEVRRPNGQAKVGDLNFGWLPVLAAARRKGAGLFPLRQLLTEDALLKQEATQHLARAQSWLLVHFLMKAPGRPPQFRAYLEAIRQRRDDAARIEDARTHLGDLEKLDRELAQYALRPARR
ncbi:MAG: DUF1570 domain-containing protein [Isosphaeraceae bacterium]|nr:DUF1570 domain-containing protein [Isosphaeraceae bacterium]